MDRKEFSEALLLLLEFEYEQIGRDVDLTLQKNYSKISS